MTADTTIQTGLTNCGQSILLQSQLGASIKFTKVKIGDGEIGDNDPKSLMDLINPLQELDIYNKEIIDYETISITALITQGETGYTFREIGLFAIDPETGSEVLYAYGNKGTSATYIPANPSSISVEEEASILVEVADTSNVIVEISRQYGYDIRFDELNGYYSEPIDGNLNITEKFVDGNENLTALVDGNIGVYSLWDYLEVLTKRIVALEMNR